MATRQAHTRLAREYKVIQENPPEYITAHPSEQNILEWHYIITGPPNTPYHGGQYWGTLVFPPNYPFAPPAIRMHTPSGRFQPSTRLCLSISDFHPKSFNPAWGISTILIGLLSFMTSEEMTLGSISASESDRRRLATQSRWWNSTGGGSARPGRGLPATAAAVTAASVRGSTANAGAILAGDEGARFRAEWPEIDAENWTWMREHRVDALTGNIIPAPPPPPPPLLSPLSSSRPTTDPNNPSSLSSSNPTDPSKPDQHPPPPSPTPTPASTTTSSSTQSSSSSSWLSRNKYWLGAMLVVAYVLISRVVVREE